ncbi:MAG: hypothetical protein QOG07_2902 [Pseudonocardiales bacterium]|nr:hypothetical protein [Pseudonocardiales bacterium]
MRSVEGGAAEASRALRLADSTVSSTGVVIGKYVPAGS